MQIVLSAHPDTPCAAIDVFEVDLDRPADNRLALKYRIGGDIDALVLPEVCDAERSDELWHSTCFEAFLAYPGSPYIELNAAPSMRWAAYRFADYRMDMSVADDVAPDRFDIRSHRSEHVLFGRKRAKARFEFAITWTIPDPAFDRMNVTAVIEDRLGVKSYWAAAHPAGAPDFHNRDCFVIQAQPPKRP